MFCPKCGCEYRNEDGFINLAPDIVFLLPILCIPYVVLSWVVYGVYYLIERRKLIFDFINKI